MRKSLAWTSLLVATVLTGCATPAQRLSALSSSTQGTTVVQMASVTAARALLVRDDQIPGTNPTDTTVIELTVRFDDGTVRSFNLDAGQIFQPGDRVKITSRHGHTRVTHE